jgi:hypothetical protein
LLVRRSCGLASILLTATGELNGHGENCDF